MKVATLSAPKQDPRSLRSPHFAVHSSRARWAVLLSSSTLLYLLFIAYSGFRANGEVYFTLFDDAMISMRYARNLAEGYGLVWNPGEVPVEGYTNPLWTLWMSLLHLLPVAPSKVPLLVMLSGVALLLANVVVVHQLARKISRGSGVVVWFATVLTALYFPLMFWTLRGMEVGLLTLLVHCAILAAFHLYERFTTQHLAWMVGAVILGSLTRPDAIVPLGVVALFAVVYAQPGKRVVSAAVLGSALVATLSGQTLLRLVYYGDTLPNTYYLKMTGTSTLDRLVVGMRALRDTFLTHLFAPVLLAIPLLRTARDPRVFLLFAVFLTQCAYSVYVGGDAWEYMRYANRYVTIGVPSLLILCGLVVHRITELAKEDRVNFTLTLLGALGLVILVQGIVLLAGTSTGSNGEYFGRYSLPRLVAGTSCIAAGALTGLGFLASARSHSRSVLRRLVEAVEQAPRLGSPLSWGLILLLILNGSGVGTWLLRDVPHLRNDIEWARLGLQVREYTSRDATIAVVAAGAIPYFSERRAIDLLGKSDTVVAKGPRRTDVPAERMHPGHDKWDYRHSIGEFRPDVIVQLWYPSRSDRAYLAGLGYQELASGMHVRTDSDRIDRAGLERTEAPVKRLRSLDLE